jgi:hypothetical protein
MVSSDSTSSPSDPTFSGPDGNIQPAFPTASTLHSFGAGRLFVCAIAAGLLAGLASVLIGERILDRYKGDLLPPIEINPSAGNVQRWKNARVYSATFTFATLGGLLGLALGLAGGLAKRSTFAGVRAAIPGLVVGSAGVGLTSFLLVSVFFKMHDPQSGDLMVPLFTHGAIWCVAGTVGGLAFGLGLGGWARCMATSVGGLAGAVVATIVYELVGALAFASSKTDLPLSTSATTRAMALLLVAALSSIGAALAARNTAKPR